MNIEQKLLGFFESNKTELVQIYINERQSHQELGALFNFVKGNDVKTVFYSLSSKFISDEVKQDIQEKNNYRNTHAFFYLTDIDTNTTLLKIEDLDKSN